MNNRQAILQLEALVLVPGALRIITNMHACGGGVHPDGSRGPFDEEKCAKFKHPLTNSRHFVVHDVVRVEGPNHRKEYRAFTEEGDHCTGQPVAVLRRLLRAGIEAGEE